MKNIRNRVIALAGVFQSAALVQQIATKGIVDEFDLITSIKSILNLSPDTVDEVYGNIENLRTGLHCMVHQLGDQSKYRDINIARYVIGLLHLERKLSKKPELLKQIASEVARAEQQSEMFGLTHSNVVANLAGTYSDTISKLSPKIMIQGEEGYLTNKNNASIIRALLLVGIRAAVLWTQVGGSRWQILFKRKKLVNEATRILNEEISSELH